MLKKYRTRLFKKERKKKKSRYSINTLQYVQMGAPIHLLKVTLHLSAIMTLQLWELELQLLLFNCNKCNLKIQLLMPTCTFFTYIILCLFYCIIKLLLCYYFLKIFGSSFFFKDSAKHWSFKLKPPTRYWNLNPMTGTSGYSYTTMHHYIYIYIYNVNFIYIFKYVP